MSLIRTGNAAKEHGVPYGDCGCVSELMWGPTVGDESDPNLQAPTF